jgi:hypothetical protein
MSHIYRSTEEGNAVLVPLTQYLAQALGEGWSVEPSEGCWGHRLVGPNEARLYLSLEGDTKGDRINISGGFHIGRTKFGNSEFVRPKSGVPSDITVALARGNEAIAREIMNRYLPKYLAALAEARTQRDADNAYKVKQQSTLSCLALLAGSQAPDLQSHTVSLSIGEIYGDIEAYGDSVTLKLRSMTRKQAGDVLTLLRK